MNSKCFLVLVLLFSVPFATASEIVVKDYLDREVKLEKPAKRVVALSPHIVENLYSAGAGNTLVGAVDYCDYPAAAHDIPRVGSISNFSLEAILALHPDLVIVWYSGHGGRVLSKLNNLGITTYASNPKSLSDVARSIRDYGTLTGNTNTAEATAKEYEKELNDITVKNKLKPKVRTLYQVWNDPIQTLNDQHIISDVIRVCGGKNVFGDSPSLAPKISIESVIAQNPAVIIASGMGDSRPDWLDEWKKWTSISAVKNNHLYFVPPDIIQRHTFRILDGTRLMCKHLDKAR